MLFTLVKRSNSQCLSVLYTHFKTAAGNALTGEAKTTRSESAYCPCGKEWQPAACPFPYGTSKVGERHCFLLSISPLAGRQILHSTGGEGQSENFVIPFGFCSSSNRSSHSGFSVAHLLSASLGTKTSLTSNINQNYELLLLDYLAAVVKH